MTAYNATAALAQRNLCAQFARDNGWHAVEPLPDRRWLHLVLGPHPSGWEIVIMWTDQGVHITASHLCGTFEIPAASADQTARAIIDPIAIPDMATIDLTDEAM